MCGQLNKEQADDDVRKTVEMFDQLGSNDPDFIFWVHLTMKAG